MRSPFPTFEMADEVPAMADYLELMERYNPEGKTAMLGMQGLSAFLLFATAANACGAELSRPVRARQGRGAGRLDRRRPPLAADPGEPGRHRVQHRHPGHARRLRVRRGAHRAERGHLQLRPRQRGRADRRLRRARSRPPDGRRRRWTSSSKRRSPASPPPPSWRSRRAASCSPTRPRASSTSPTARSACWGRSPTGSCASAGGGRRPSRSLVVLGVLAPLLGVVIERVVMRGLDDAPETSRVVVSIGLLAALLGVGPVGVAPRRGPARSPGSGATRACRCSAST